MGQLTQEEQAQLLAAGKANTPYVDPPPVPAAPPAAPQGMFTPGSAADLIASFAAPGAPVVMRGLRYPAVARTMLGPLGPIAGPALAEAGTESADGSMRGLNESAKRILSHDEKQDNRLKEMNTPLASVQAAPTLTMPQVGRGAGGFGGAGGSGIGDAARAYRDAQQNELALMGDVSRMTREEGVAKADRIDAVADKEEQQAQEQINMANQQAAIQADADNYAYDFMKGTMKMNQDLASAKVDRRRVFKNMNAGDSVMFGLSAALSGMMQGLQGGPNRFLEYVERQVDADVRDQMEEINNKKAAIGNRQNMFGQLLQQSGNRNVASMQLMGLQLEAMKQQTKAFAERQGIPEALKAADISSKMIDGKIAALNTGIKQEIYMQKVKEAQAAAAARAAAEKMAHDRRMEILKLGQEQDKIDIERMKATGTNAKAIDEKVEKLGTALGAADMARGRESLDRLAAQLEKTKKGEHIEGLGLGSKIVKSLPGGEHLVSDQANINEQDWNAILGVYSNIRTGSGGSDAEAKKILKEAEGANTPAERANFIRKMQADFQRREDAIRAAAGPEASARYDQNKAAIRATLPATVQIKQPDQPVNPWLRK